MLLQILAANNDTELTVLFLVKLSSLPTIFTQTDISSSVTQADR